MPVIKVEKVSFSYTVPVLEEIDFVIAEGEFIGVFGPNGGGKTTLLSLLMGFLKPSQGRILIGNQSPVQARSKIAWVPQNFYYDRHFPICVEEVVLGGRLSHLSWLGRFAEVDYTIAREALKRVSMEDFIKVPFNSLSGGQAQRVLIARALASFPQILLLDEPTASVDYTVQTEIYHMLRSLKEEMTIIMVTHDLNGALEHVDRLFCVQKNLIAMSREEVCDHFAHGLYHSPLKIGKLKNP